MNKKESVTSSKKAGLRGLSPKAAALPPVNDMKTLDKEFKYGWFKKNSNFLIDTVDNLLSDQSFSSTTIRLSLLFLSNLF
jgi:hypothetical protein